MLYDSEKHITHNIRLTFEIYAGLRQASYIYNVSINDILVPAYGRRHLVKSANKNKNLRAARVYVAAYMMEKLSWSVVDITRFLDMSPPVVYSLKQDYFKNDFLIIN